jgi:hypothetical protein
MPETYYTVAHVERSHADLFEVRVPAKERARFTATVTHPQPDWDEEATVSWPSIGAVEPDLGAAVAQALAQASARAAELNASEKA